MGLSPSCSPVPLESNGMGTASIMVGRGEYVYQIREHWSFEVFAPLKQEVDLLLLRWLGFIQITVHL